MVFNLPVELLLLIGSCLPRDDQLSLATTCKGIRKIFMTLIFGGTVYIRSPLPIFHPNLFELFDYLQQGMPGLQKCIDQVEFYQQRSDVARSVHTVHITNWIAFDPQFFRMTTRELAETEPKYEALLKVLTSNQHCLNDLWKFRSVYDSIIVKLVQFLPFSELQLTRTHLTENMHFALHRTPQLKRLTLQDCTIEAPNFHTAAGHGGQYESFKAISRDESYVAWNDTPSQGLFIQPYLLLSCSTLTKLEICIEFLRYNALDRVSFPSLTSLAIVPYAGFDFEMWSWGTVYRLLKISPNTTWFRFEPLQKDVVYPFDEPTNWNKYKRSIGNLPLSRLSSITGYRQLVKRLVPGRPVSFVKILLFPDNESSEFNWPDPESDDEEINDDIKASYMVPYQLVRSATPIKTLCLQRIDEQEEIRVAISAGDIGFLRNACPHLTDLWIPSLKITSRRRHYRNPVDMKEILDKLRIWDEMTLERCAVGSCSPWMAKELEWYREGTIMHRRVHPTLKELLLGVDVLWKWQDDTEVTGWVLYVSDDIEGSDSDSEEGIHPPDSRYADSVSSDELETDSDSE